VAAVLSSIRLLDAVWAHKVAVMVAVIPHKQVQQELMAQVVVAVVLCLTADQQATKAAMVLL
jgi:hypothetical protein